MRVGTRRRALQVQGGIVASGPSPDSVKALETDPVEFVAFGPVKDLSPTGVRRPLSNRNQKPEPAWLLEEAKAQTPASLNNGDSIV